MTNKIVPLVSVCMPVFNGATTISKALDSLLSQTWPSIEIIICDDGSADETINICREYASKNKNIIFEKNKENLGPSARNFRKTLSKASGEYCFWASQDDIWHVDFVKTLVTALESNPEASVAMCSTEYFMNNKGKRESLFVAIKKVDDWPQHMGRFRTAVKLFLEPGNVTQIRQGIVPNLVISLFIHGVFKTNILKTAFAVIPPVLQKEHQVLGQIALASDLIYIDKTMFYKEEVHCFCSLEIESETLKGLLDYDNFQKHKNRRGAKNKSQGSKVSKYQFAWDTLKIFMASELLSFPQKMKSLLLVMIYTLRWVFRPIISIFRSKRKKDRRYNLLLQTPNNNID